MEEIYPYPYQGDAYGHLKHALESIGHTFATATGKVLDALNFELAERCVNYELTIQSMHANTEALEDEIRKLEGYIQAVS